MRRRNRVPASGSVFESRLEAIEALKAAENDVSKGEGLNEIAVRMRTEVAGLGVNEVSSRYNDFCRLLEGAGYLCQWAAAIRSAAADSERYLKAGRQAGADVLRKSRGDAVRQAAETLAGVAEVADVERTVREVGRVPLPVPLWATPVPEHRVYAEVPKIRESLPKKELAVVSVSFVINGVNLNAPHRIDPNVVHDLGITGKVSGWPTGAEELVLEPLSVEQAGIGDLPVYRFKRPGGSAPYEISATGRLRIEHEQAPYTRPLEFTYQGRFLPAGFMEVEILGQREVRLIASTRSIPARYEKVEARVLALGEKARHLPGVRNEELADFLQLLAALGDLAAVALQDNVFRGQWTEKRFQDEVRNRLRQDNRIGKELEEHPAAGGGVMDLSFRRIPIELKVESEHFVDIGKQIPGLSQATQYVAGRDRQFGLCCILDASAKTSPPGMASNDMELVPVQPTGTAQGVPIVIGVVVVRGNLARPSDLR